MNSKITTQELTKIALLATIVLLASFINFTLPLIAQGGLIHLGTVTATIATLICGRKVGTIAGTIGMTLFDILGGFIVWAPITFVARIGFGFLLGTIAYARNKQGQAWLQDIIGIIMGGIWLIISYYLGEAMLYGNLVAPLLSIPGDIVQLGLSIAIGIPVAIFIQKTIKKY